MALRDLFGRREAASEQAGDLQQTQAGETRLSPSQEPEPVSMSAPEVEAAYSMSPGFVARLAKLNTALAATSYQSGLLYLLGRNPRTGGLNVHQTAIRRPMGWPDGYFVPAA
jgi:hypothetical protein